MFWICVNHLCALSSSESSLSFPKPMLTNPLVKAVDITSRRALLFDSMIPEGQAG
jgi:hypothetical protein